MTTADAAERLLQAEAQAQARKLGRAATAQTAPRHAPQSDPRPGEKRRKHGLRLASVNG